MPSLADRIAGHVTNAAQVVAREITNNPASHAELIEHLEPIWLKTGADHDGTDELWLRVVVALPLDTLNTCYAAAYQAGHYSAARCLAWHRAQLH